MERASFLGTGVNLKRQHFADALASDHNVDWFEVIVENFLSFGGRPREVLEGLSQRFPLVGHGLSLNLASSSAVDRAYVEQLKWFLNHYQIPWFSDHLCLQGAHGFLYHDLIPALRTEETVAVAAAKVDDIQQTIGRPMAIENVSIYAEGGHHTMEEGAFMAAIAERADCGLLLDLNNIYVNAHNFNWDPYTYLQSVDWDRVFEIHLAGPESGPGGLFIDTHGAAVQEEVWALYRWSLGQAQRPISTLIEWDNNTPAFHHLTEEVSKARQIQADVFASREFRCG